MGVYFVRFVGEDTFFAELEEVVAADGCGEGEEDAVDNSGQ